MEEQKYENLFYRPNMTPKDRMNLQKVLVMLKRNGMDTPKHIQMLERVVYLPHAILIADVPFARKNRKAIPNGKDIFLHGNDILFLPSVLPSQDAEMQKQ